MKFDKVSHISGKTNNRNFKINFLKLYNYEKKYFRLFFEIKKKVDLGYIFYE